MEGTVVSFLPSKGYGFIRGDDNNDYFLHLREVLDACKLRPGMRVAFEEAATPKGYRAKRVQPIGTAGAERYETPSKLLDTKRSEFEHWEVIEAVPYLLIGTSRDSVDAARSDLRGRASSVGANALMRVEYFRATGSEASSTGRGTHQFTIHNFRAVPAVVGRQVMAGGATREELVGLGARLNLLAAEFASQNRRRRRWGAILVVAGIACLFVGGLFSAVIPSALMFICAYFLFQPVGVWLQSMGTTER